MPSPLPDQSVSQSGPVRGLLACRKLSLPLMVPLTSVLLTHGALAAMTPQTQSGLPPQVIPMVAEVGAPQFSVGGGSISQADPSANQSTTTTVSADPSAQGGVAPSYDVSAVGASNALSTMTATSWGQQAANNAAALGVNPSAEAATCVIESGCQNLQGTGTVEGAFQMKGTTYTAALNAALAQDPSLSSNIVPGLAGQMDPATESIAAAEYLSQAAQALQAGGITNPTVLQARGYYNFGPTYAVAIAQAPDDASMSDVLSGVSSSTLTNNGIKQGETVGQWRASVTSKIGADAASQPVLLGGSAGA